MRPGAASEVARSTITRASTSPVTITGGWTAESSWTPERMYIAEREARKTVRARLSGHGVFAHSPDLPDDAAFFAARDRGQDWTGHWYSRDRVGALEWQ